jgi:hypothetical protein
MTDASAPLKRLVAGTSSAAERLRPDGSGRRRSQVTNLKGERWLRRRDSLGAFRKTLLVRHRQKNEVVPGPSSRAEDFERIQIPPPTRCPLAAYAR